MTGGGGDKNEEKEEEEETTGGEASGPSSPSGRREFPLELELELELEGNKFLITTNQNSRSYKIIEYSPKNLTSKDSGCLFKC